MNALSSYHADSMTSSELYDDVITNLTSGDAYDSHVGPVESLVEALTLGTISLVAVVGNAALWLVILMNRGLRIESNMLILCLSLADLLVSTVSMPVTVATITSSRWIFSKSTCVAMGYLNMITFTASVQSLAVISWNRYVKICLPHRYTHVFTYLKTGCMCLGVWLVSGLLSLPPLLGWAAYSYLPNASLCFCNWALSFSYALFMIFACFCVPCIVMTFCNVNILRAFLHSRRAIQAYKDKDKDKGQIYNHKDKDKGQIYNHKDKDKGQIYNHKDKDKGQIYNHKDKEKDQMYNHKDKEKDQMYNHKDKDKGQIYNHKRKDKGQIYNHKHKDKGQIYNHKDKEKDQMHNHKDKNKGQIYNHKDKDKGQIYNHKHKDKGQIYNHKHKDKGQIYNYKDKEKDKIYTHKDKEKDQICNHNDKVKDKICDHKDKDNIYNHKDDDIQV